MLVACWNPFAWSQVSRCIPVSLCVLLELWSVSSVQNGLKLQVSCCLILPVTLQLHMCLACILQSISHWSKIDCPEPQQFSAYIAICWAAHSCCLLLLVVQHSVWIQNQHHSHCVVHRTHALKLLNDYWLFVCFISLLAACWTAGSSEYCTFQTVVTYVMIVTCHMYSISDHFATSCELF